MDLQITCQEIPLWKNRFNKPFVRCPGNALLFERDQTRLKENKKRVEKFVTLTKEWKLEQLFLTLPQPEKHNDK